MSVRDRIERAERQEIENRLDGIRVNTATQQGGTGMSLRERAERQRSLETVDNEKLVPLDKHRATGMAHQNTFNSRLRDRLAKLEHERQEQAVKPTQQDAISYFYNEHMKEEAAKKAAEAAEEKQRQTLAEQRRCAAEVEKQRQDEHRKMLAVDVALGSATADEVRRVKSIVASNFPSDRYSPERNWLVLMQLREAVGIPEGNPKPNWTEIF